MNEEDEPHRTEVTGSLQRQSWYVRCSCGYESGSFPSQRLAEDDADEHVLAAI